MSERVPFPERDPYLQPTYERALVESDEYDVDVYPPFYFVTKGTELLIGPVGTESFAREIAERFVRAGHEGICVRARKTPDVVQCRLCDVRMLPWVASQSSDLDGNVVDYTCGECFMMEWEPVFNAMGGFFEEELL